MHDFFTFLQAYNLKQMNDKLLQAPNFLSRLKMVDSKFLERNLPFSLRAELGFVIKWDEI